MEKHKKKGRVEKAVRRALQAGAAYGVLAGGAFGAYQLAAPHDARSQDPAREAPEPERLVWSTKGAFAAQTRFLKILYAAWDDGEARVRSFRRAVDETYGMAREDLGKLFGGTLEEKVSSVEILGTGAVAITLSWTPGRDSPEAGFKTLRIRYLVSSRPPVSGEAALREKATGRVAGKPVVRVISKEGFSEAKKEWESLAIPPESQPMMEPASPDDEGPEDCSYPRWNPRGVRYGFFGREGLESWYS